MDKVYIGKVVDTHGIKGEIRILSDFPFKDKVFVVGKEIIIDQKNYVIQSYRVHKNYDMVTLDVYVSKESLNLNDNEVLDEELITYEVLTNDGKKGIIKEIFMASETNKILRVEFDKEVLIPMNSPMIEKIDKEKKQVLVHLINGI